MKTKAQLLYSGNAIKYVHASSKKKKMKYVHAFSCTYMYEMSLPTIPCACTYANNLQEIARNIYPLLSLNVI